MWYFCQRNTALFKINLNKEHNTLVMITVTEQAKKQAIRLMEDDGKAGYFIRVGVEGGGCSGLMYQLTFDNQENPDDKIFEDNGVKVVVDKKSFLYLIGTTLDFSGGLNGKGFVFSNPNAGRTCGCGESFSL
jgi:iron-sulfur cluster assembly protein